MRVARPLHAARGIVALSAAIACALSCCHSGVFDTGPPDSGPDADNDSDEVMCGTMVCPQGAECIDGVCLPRTTDGDGDGFNANVDCDDNDDSVIPGSTTPCLSGCGEGASLCGDDGRWGPCMPTDDSCDLPNAESLCEDDRCVIVACDGFWSNCDNSDETGCETHGVCSDLTCQEVIDCMQGCGGNENCDAVCIEHACGPVAGPIEAMYTCILTYCATPCDADPTAEACHSCVDTHCNDLVESCIEIEC